MPSEKFNLTEWLKNLFKKEPKNSEQEQVTDKRIPLLNAEITKLKETISETNKILSEKETEISTLKELAKSNSTPLDEYCIKNKYKTVKKVYKDKIIINNVTMPCDLREIFTPNSYVVRKVAKSILYSDNDNIWYQRIMKKVNSIITWTADGRYDNYYYPNYTLTIGKGDCDDFAFAQMSIEPKLGVAFGYYKDGEGKRIGHAFSIGIVDNYLYIFDGTSNTIMRYIHDKEKGYYIHYIITKNEVYTLDASVDFGDILWEE